MQRNKKKHPQRGKSVFGGRVKYFDCNKEAHGQTSQESNPENIHIGNKRGESGEGGADHISVVLYGLINHNLKQQVVFTPPLL